MPHKWFFLRQTSPEELGHSKSNEGRVQAFSHKRFRTVLRVLRDAVGLPSIDSAWAAR